MYVCKMASFGGESKNANRVITVRKGGSFKEALQQFDGSLLEIRLPKGWFKSFSGTIGDGYFRGLQLDGENRWDGLRIVTPEVEVTYGPSGYSVAFPDALQTITPYAFSGCSSLTSVAFPDALQTIGAGAFHGCSSLASVALPDALQTIEEYAFGLCSSLASVDLSTTNVQTIGEHAFSKCSSLASARFPLSLKAIGAFAFLGCNLRNVEVGDKIEIIGVFDEYVKIKRISDSSEEDEGYPSDFENYNFGPILRF